MTPTAHTMTAELLLEAAHQLGRLTEAEALAIELFYDLGPSSPSYLDPAIARHAAGRELVELELYAQAWDEDAGAAGNESAAYSLAYQQYCERWSYHGPEVAKLDFATFTLLWTLHARPEQAASSAEVIALYVPELKDLLEDIPFALLIEPEQGEPGPDPEEPRPLTVFRITLHDDESASVESYTNDDQDRGYTGYPGCDSHWDMQFQTLEAALKVTGYTRAGVLSDVKVYIGHNLAYDPASASPAPSQA